MASKKISSQDKALFQKAMTGVEPIKKIKKKENKQSENKQIKFYPRATKRTESRVPFNSNKWDDDYLSDYISDPIFDNTVLNYQQNPLPLKQIKQLKSGGIHYQRKLDLHGFRADEAKAKLISCLKKARQDGIRCILLIHGKGGCRAEPPRIKNLVNVWLRQIPEVTAFHSATPRDGGTGTLYVLLKHIASKTLKP